ncbi:iron ABC transporter permease [Streptococcus sp. UMB1385]|uniref:iron ABC transporter permease n=1 Tax=Gemella haemolysans TaxID=1379 RepID=UPI000C8077AE|nr:iron ABC transporter permease [Gemella haemolysans]PMC47978.1 iron ABC transporter permease [Streptococcus sp. UMB1385]
MMFILEFGKLFRRKFNYLFAIILILLNLVFAYKLSTFATFFDMSEINIIFNIVFKIDLILILFIMGINYILSYREDYISKVNVLIEVRKKKSIRDFSAILASLIYFLIYYVIIVTSLLATLFVRKNSLFTELKSIMMNASTAGAYATMLILLLLFANIIFLLSLTLFNNTNLAISVSLLFFLGGEVIANMIKARVNFASERIDNSVLTIFTKSFNNLNQYITFNLATFLPVVLNIIGLVIVIYIVRFIKKIFG